MKDHHLHQKEEISPSESSIPTSPFREKEQKREGDQDRDDIAEHLGLSLEIRKQWKRDIAAIAADGAYQLEKWKPVPPLPEEVGQGDGGREGAANPKPAMTQALAKRCEEDTNDQSGEPEDDAVLV